MRSASISCCGQTLRTVPMRFSMKLPHASERRTSGGRPGNGRLSLSFGHEHDLIGRGQDLDNRKRRGTQRAEGVMHGQFIGTFAIAMLWRYSPGV
jgi:hypothetical protein